MHPFLSSNEPQWLELGELLREAKKSPQRLSPEKISRLDELYRLTSIQLSQVSSRTSDVQLIRYLNDLTAAAHSAIYLPPKKSSIGDAVDFVLQGFAQAIARTWRYQTVALGLTLLGGALAYHVAKNDPIAAYALLPAGDVRAPGSTPEQLLEVLRSGRNQAGGEKFIFASFLFGHNLKVGLLAMGVGVLAAIPTALLLVYNGMMLGAFAHLHHDAGIYSEFWAWILPHGITEIGAIILCGGVGLMLGDAVIRPRQLSRLESLRRAGVEAAYICVGIAGMLFAAAIIESYLRQSHLSTSARMSFAATTLVFWTVYIAYGFLSQPRQQPIETTEPALSSQEILGSQVDELIDQRNS